MATGSGDFLTLSEAAARLNVHPSTLRRWADAGDILAMVTPGGHRRFPVSEVDRLVAHRPESGRDSAFEDRWIDSVVSYTRRELSEPERPAWIAEFSDDERATKRKMGRQLVTLLGQYVDSSTDNESALLDKARLMGSDYAADARAHGMRLGDVLQVILFFRDRILESAMASGGTKPDPAARKRRFRRANVFLNEFLLSATESFA